LVVDEEVEVSAVELMGADSEEATGAADEVEVTMGASEEEEVGISLVDTANDDELSGTAVEVELVATGVVLEATLTIGEAPSATNCNTDALSPAPHISPCPPIQSKLHSESAVSTEVSLNDIPVKHSRP
jgi:hypothetical protein